MTRVQFEKLNNTSTVAVEKATGKSWDEWIKIIDAFGAASMTHKEIARKLYEDKLIESGWWCQMITVGYEFAKGRRTKGETEGTGFEIGVSKTLPVSTEKLWEVLMSPQGIAVWLGKTKNFNLEKGFHYETTDKRLGEIRTIDPGIKVRLTYQTKPNAPLSTLQIYLMANGKYNSKETDSAKTAIRFHHEKLKDKAERDAMKEHWEEVIEKLTRLI